MTGWITGIGWVNGDGCGHGRAAQAAPCWTATVSVPTRRQVFAKADLRFGRLDDFSRVGLAAIACCLRDAGLEQWQHKRAIGIVAATRKGCLTTDLAYLDTLLASGGALASPNLFAYTLPNCFLGEAALRFGLVGNSLIINQSPRNDLEVLRYALQELSWSCGQQGVLAGFCDVPPPDEKERAGALFVMIEATADTGTAPYGRLDLQGDRLVFNGRAMPDVDALVAACFGTMS